MQMKSELMQKFACSMKMVKGTTTRHVMKSTTASEMMYTVDTKLSLRRVKTQSTRAFPAVPARLSTANIYNTACTQQHRQTAIVLLKCFCLSQPSKKSAGFKSPNSITPICPNFGEVTVMELGLKGTSRVCRGLSRTSRGSRHSGI